MSQENHECSPPEAKSSAEVWACQECGIIYQFDEVSEIWESVGNVEEEAG